MLRQKFLKAVSALNKLLTEKDKFYKHSDKLYDDSYGSCGFVNNLYDYEDDVIEDPLDVQSCIVDLDEAKSKRYLLHFQNLLRRPTLKRSYTGEKKEKKDTPEKEQTYRDAMKHLSSVIELTQTSLNCNETTVEKLEDALAHLDEQYAKYLAKKARKEKREQTYRDAIKFLSSSIELTKKLEINKTETEKLDKELEKINAQYAKDLMEKLEKDDIPNFDKISDLQIFYGRELIKHSYPDALDMVCYSYTYTYDDGKKAEYCEYSRKVMKGFFLDQFGFFNDGYWYEKGEREGGERTDHLKLHNHISKLLTKETLFRYEKPAE
jgi:hypothetical protein